jgi:hypothetical protein
MSPIKKSDVKNHLSAHNRHGIHLYRPGSQPAPTDFSDGESERANAETNSPNGAPLEQSPSSAMTIPPIGPDSDAAPVVKVAE